MRMSESTCSGSRNCASSMRRHATGALGASIDSMRGVVVDVVGVLAVDELDIGACGDEEVDGAGDAEAGDDLVGALRVDVGFGQRHPRPRSS